MINITIDDYEVISSYAESDAWQKHIENRETLSVLLGYSAQVVETYLLWAQFSPKGEF